MILILPVILTSGPTWESIDVGDKCNYNVPEYSISVSDNTCVDFDVNDDSDCDPTVFGGFSCA